MRYRITWNKMTRIAEDEYWMKDHIATLVGFGYENFTIEKLPSLVKPIKKTK